MPDNINTAMINTVKETIKSSAIWNKLVKTIENANINMDKLIQDSVEYGIEIGMFQQNKDGSIECKDTKKSLAAVVEGAGERFACPQTTGQKPASGGSASRAASEDMGGLAGSSLAASAAVPRSDSETTASACSGSQSIVMRTRKSAAADKELKRASVTMTTTTVAVGADSGGKRLKRDSGDDGTETGPRRSPQRLSIVENQQKSVAFVNGKPGKGARDKVKPVNRKMVKPIPICAFCLGDEALNKRTKKPENMISCFDCGTCAHPTCLQWPDSLFQKVRTIRWQCLQCKRCSYCGMISKKDDDMLLCDVCDQGFHIYCCDPPIKILPKGEWVCRFCKPSGSRSEKPNFFSSEDFDFQPDCQIITPESVRKLCNISPKPVNNNSTKKNRLKIKSKLSKKSKINPLHLKKKKLVSKAVQRQRQALTDGLSKFFTPSNKRQSRVSKQSISSESLFDKENKKSPTITPPKDKSSNRSVISSSRSKSPITSDIVDESIVISEIPKPNKKRVVNKKGPEISVYHSPKRNSQDSETKMKNDNVKEKMTKYKLKKLQLSLNTPGVENSPIRRPGRPKKQVLFDKNGSPVDNNTTITESSSITMSKNDHGNNYSVLSAENCESDPYPISDMDRQWYTEIQQKVVELLPPPVDAAPQLQPLNKLNTSCKNRNEHTEPPELSVETNHTSDGDHLSNTNNLDASLNMRYPPRIQIGRYIIDTWYSAPYPSEYARLNVLYICEYCLKPIKSYDVYVMHMEKCTFYFPPGNEIYRSGDLSVFEVDGYVSKLYCQQLCLLAKLFLDHKTLYYDVEPFLFYVAVVSKNKSSHIIGYFSKEKRSTHKYNLSCIMVLPPHQKYNYGRFLIDFSYLLSRKEGQFGSPEKPLSTLGRISYESYWKSKILPFILNKDDVTIDFYARQKIYKPPKGLAVTIDRVSTETGISPHDVASTIQLLSKKVDLDNSDRISIQFDWEKLKTEAEKYASRYPKWIPVDEDCLRWVPLINPNEKSINPIRSPTNTVNNSRDSLSTPKPDVSKPTKDSNESNQIQSAIESPSSVTNASDNVSANRNKSNNSKLSKKKRESVTTKRVLKSTPKTKSPNIPKPAVNGKNDSSNNQTKSSKKKTTPANRDEIVTRNKSIQLSTSNSSLLEDASPIKVDLTKESSENSDNQENDDCIEISASIPRTRTNDVWNNKKPVFEIFKDKIVPPTMALKVSPPKESPPLTRNDPSPVSAVHNEIIGPVLIDEDNEDEIEIEDKIEAKADHVDSQIHDTIDLSDDVAVETDNETPQIHEIKDRNVFIAMENCDGKSIEVVIEERNQIPSSNSEDSLTSTTSEALSEASKNDEFVLPSAVKESQSIDDSEKPPILSRISSQEDTNSAHLDDSSTSFNLSADISQTEEFKRFYNDGHVFNSITTSQTDSSEKDADESLLSASNSNSYGPPSDADANGVYSCDSSICYNLRPRLRHPLRLDEPGLFLDTGNCLRCSPGQSDRVQNHVSSTTPFVSPDLTDASIDIKCEDINVPSGKADDASSDRGTGAIAVSGKCYSDIITFEDVGIVTGNGNNHNNVPRNEPDCIESVVSGGPEHHGDTRCDKHDTSKHHSSSSGDETRKIDIISDRDTDKPESDKINIDVVSSSFNESSIISDSSH